MQKYETAKIEVTKFQPTDVIMTSGVWYPGYNDNYDENNAPGYDAGDIWSDLFGGNP
ncbi:MAG: hypothetical protein Q4C01_02085 [Clostridia bacterium]|nr:hypothetical protein [Clostridia bacterium]